MRTPIGRTFSQLGFFRLGLPAATRSSPEEERVMHLFRNRAELKKSYNQQGSELQQLRDRLKQQEGVTARAQDMLHSLQRRLAHPDSAYPAMVYYQLRDLGQVAHMMLEQHVRELRQQREALERGAFQRECRRIREAQLAVLDRGCRELDVATQAAASQLRVLHQQLALQQGWWRFLKRRRLRQQLHEASVRQVQAVDALALARAERDQAAEEPEPLFPGLSVAMRRAINVAAIAYAQVLNARLERCRLLEPTRIAMSAEDVPDGAYGDRAACEQLMAGIGEARGLLQQRATLQDELQHVTMGLRSLLRYENDQASVPDAAALAAASVGTGVLLENAWDIGRLLI